MYMQYVGEHYRMGGKARAARAKLSEAIALLNDAELCQSECADIAGPGSSEWEAVRSLIQKCQSDLDACMERPGALENADESITLDRFEIIGCYYSMMESVKNYRDQLAGKTAATADAGELRMLIRWRETAMAKLNDTGVIS